MYPRRVSSRALARAILLSTTALLVTPALASDFTSIGPAPVQGMNNNITPPSYLTYSGAVTDIVTDPADSKTLYIGTADGGVWVTHDGGVTWTPLTDKQISLSIDSLSSDPTDATHQTLIAGTGQISNGLTPNAASSPNAMRGGLQAGLLYSNNGGATWSQLGGTALSGQSVDGVAARGNIILAGTFDRQNGGYSGGLYRSTDGGTNFTLVSGTGGLPAGPVSDIVADPNNTATLYAAVTAPNAASKNATAIYVSTDTGATWTEIFNSTNAGGAIDTTDQTQIRLATGPGGTIAAGVVNMSTGKVSGLFYSANSGTTWKALSVPSNLNTGGQANVNFTLAVDPNNPNFVYIAGDTTNNTVNGAYALTAYRVDATSNTATSLYGANTADGSTVHPDGRGMAFDSNGNLIVSTDGGIYTRTQPQTNTGVWQSLTGNLSAIETYQAVYGANSHLVAVAAQDNSASLESAAGSVKYNEIYGGDGTIAAVNDQTLAGKSVYYLSVQNLVNSSVRVIVDASGNIIANQNLTFNINPNPGNAQFFVPFVLNKIDPSMIAIGGNNVYLTQDTVSGANAPGTANVSLNLTNLGGDGNGTTTIAYGTKDNTNALIASIGNTIWMSTSTAGGINALPNYLGLTPVSLVFDTRTQQRFFATDGTTLWGTTDQGASFQNLVPNLPAGFIRPNALEFVDNNGVDALLVGGLGNAANVQSTVVTADSSATGALSNWRFLGTSLPNAPVNFLSYNPLVDVLTVSTFGRGVWLMYDFTSNYSTATTLQFGLADNNSTPAASLLSGNRPLVKYGSGTLLITGDGTYTGGSTINAGTMQLGNGGASGSILGDVVDNGQFTIDRSDTYTFGGAISGTGAFTQAGTGTTVFTGANTYTGGTTVAAGTLQIGNGGTTGSINGNVTDNGQLVIDRSDNINIASVISGTGGITQAGPGTVSIAGTQTYTGTTNVTAGTLSVNGSIASSSGVAVGNGGTLAGTGTVPTTTIASGGTISPGNSPGTLNVNGNLTLAAGSTYNAEFTPTTSDKLQVGGTVTIAGQLLLAPSAGTYTSGFVYTLINSTGALSGVFSKLIFNGNFGSYIPVVSYDANDVFVTLTGMGTNAWSGTPGSSDWNTASNWTNNTVPAATDTALFNATTKSTIDIQKLGTSVGGLQFNAGAPAYIFNVTGTQAGASSLVIGATGIVDNSGNTPNFVVSGVAGDTGTLEFDNGSTAGDATITANGFGNVLFTGLSNAASAQLVTGTGGTVDISGLASTGLTAGSIAGSGSFVLGAKSLSADALNLSTEVSGVISGTGGSLDKVGTGTLTLSGANTYTGGTTISGGTLQLGNGGASGSILGDVVDNGQFTIDRSDTYTFGGAISGTGAFTQAGTGTTVFTGANTYTGGTTVAAGTLQIGNGGTTGSINGNVTDNGQLVIDRSDNINIASVISGTGGITQAGPGTVSIAGTQTYTGATNVTAGTLSVNGSIASSSGVTVGNGGTLAGTGIVPTTTVASGGTISPGNSVGTLNVSGNLTLAAGSIYSVDVTPSVSDETIVAGTVSIAGNLLLSGGTGTYTLGKYYTLLNSTGLLSGPFANVTFNGSFGGYVPAISYDAHDVLLTLSNQIFWQANPGSTDWNTGTNWTSNTVPTAADTAGFSATTTSTIDIQKAGTQIGGLEFVAGAPAYTFNITGTASGASSLTIGGAGILDHSSNAPSFTVSGVAGNAATLEFDNGATAGDATITANAFGNILFTGMSDAGSANLVTGSGGTVDISALASTGMSAGSISGAGSFVLGGKALTVGGLNTSTVVSGTIVGAGGSLVKSGTGTLTLSGTNTYSGGTIINAGTLQLGSGGTSGSVVGNIADNGQLTFNRSGTYTFGGIVSGTGRVSQVGTGTTVLTGYNTYIGTTVVSAGVLEVDGSIANSSSVSVGAGGTLQGSGAVGPLSVASGGSVSPGSGTGSVGQLSVMGNVNLNAGSDLQIDTSAGGTDLLAAAGNLNLAGTATFNALSTPHYGDTAVFAIARTISGAFASVPDTVTGVLYPVVSTANVAGGQELVVTMDAASFQSQFTSKNPDVITIANALDAARANHYSDLKALYDAVDPLTGSKLISAFGQLAPYGARSLPLLTTMQVSAFTNEIWNRLARLGTDAGGQSTAALDINTNGLDLAQRDLAPFSDQNSILNFARGVDAGGLQQAVSTTPAQLTSGWSDFGRGVRGFLSGSSLDGHLSAGGGRTASVNGYLISGGVDVSASNGFVVGAALSYADSTAKTPSTDLSSTQSSAFQGVAYAKYMSGAWFVDGFAGASAQNLSLNRTIAVGAATYHLHGRTTGTSPTAGGSVGYQFDTSDITILPSAGLQWLNTSIGAFTESGGAVAMTYGSQSRDSVMARVGFDALGHVSIRGVTVRPLLHAFLVHDFESSNGSLTAAFVKAPSALMTFDLAPRSSTWAEIGVGAEADVSNNVSVGVRYDTMAGRSELFSGAWTGQLDVRF